MIDPKFFDLSAFKASIKDSTSKIKNIPKNNDEDLFTMSLALTAAVKKVVFEKSKTKFSSEPSINKELITQFHHRMRVDGMEKFNQTTFFSVVHFYKDAAALHTNKLPLGLLIVYIDRKFVPEMLRLLDYPYIDYDRDEEVLDGIGAITNLIGGYFKKELSQLGFVDLEMSAFKSYLNTVVDGVNYCQEQTYKYEASFEIDGQKHLVVDMVMGVPPKRIEQKWGK